MSNEKPRGYTYRVVQTAAGPRGTATFTCVGCQRQLNLSNHMRHSAEFFAARARHHGWQAHPKFASKCYCPKCCRPTREQTMRTGFQIDAMLKGELLSGSSHASIKPPEVVQMTDYRAPEKPRAATIVPDRAAGGQQMTVTTVNPKPPQPEQAREPTLEERQKIVELMVTHFDIKTGTYLNDMSDQEIARMVGVPWNIVHKMREATWGPLRTDPALTALRRQLKELEQKMEAQQQQLEDLRTAIDAYGRVRKTA